jgi:flagellar biosynthesis protein FliQ
MQHLADDSTILGLTFESWMILGGLVVIVGVAVLAAKLYIMWEHLGPFVPLIMLVVCLTLMWFATRDMDRFR